MFARIRDIQAISVLLTAAVISAVCTSASADDGPSRESPKHYYILEDDTPVRSNASSRAYVFGTIDRGDIVRVIDERDGWLRVAIVGPAFDDFFGYMKYRRGQEGRYEIDRNAGTLTTLGIASIVAPNLDADNNPNQSWKAILRVPAETELEWFDTRETDRELVQLVRLPEDAEGWLNPRHVRSASRSEVAQWEELRADPDRRQEPAVDPEQADEPATDEAEEPDEEPRDDPEDEPGEETPSEEPDGAERSEEADESDARSEEDARRDEESSEDPDEQTDPEADPDAADPDDPVTEPSGEEPAEDEPADEEDEQPELTLDDVERILENVRGDEVESAELRELQRLYREVADQHDEGSSRRRFAEARIEQLELRIEAQDRRREVLELRRRAERDREDAEARRRALDARADYNIVGYLNTSSIYDGRDLPRLFRVQDPESSRTLAYIQPDEEFDLVGMLGQMVGIVGNREYDGSLRLHLVEPRRIEVLAESSN